MSSVRTLLTRLSNEFRFIVADCLVPGNHQKKFVETVAQIVELQRGGSKEMASLLMEIEGNNSGRPEYCNAEAEQRLRELEINRAVVQSMTPK